MHELISAGRRAARLLDADDASLLRIVDDTLEQLTDESGTLGRRWPLDAFPATRALLAERTPGQIVVGDPQSDRDEVRELQRLGYNALLIVPMRLGEDRQAILEVYRRHPQAFTGAEMDRARVVALQFAAVLDRVVG
jgi:GAF domain-containing protein